MELPDIHSMNSKSSPLVKYAIRELLVALCLEFVSVRSQTEEVLNGSCPVQPVRPRSLQRVREDGLTLPGLAVSRRSTNSKQEFEKCLVSYSPTS